jgi:hypothetical protein
MINYLKNYLPGQCYNKHYDYDQTQSSIRFFALLIFQRNQLIPHRVINGQGEAIKSLHLLVINIVSLINNTVSFVMIYAHHMINLIMINLIMIYAIPTQLHVLQAVPVRQCHPLLFRRCAEMRLPAAEYTKMHSIGEYTLKLEVASAAASCSVS